MTLLLRSLHAARRARIGLCGILLTMLLGLLHPPGAHAAGVVGNGTPASCTEQALRGAIAGGGKVTFNCGPDPATITLSSEIELKNTNLELDGGNKITLSGGGKTRLFRIYTTTSTFRNLTMRDTYGDGGAAMYVSHVSTITISNVQFLNNNGTRIDSSNSGGALHLRHSVITIEDSLFEGNRGINGGAINNLGNTLYVIRSTFRNNDSTPGGIAADGRSGQHGLGGAIYIDGARNRDAQSSGGTIDIRDSQFIGNRARQQGGAVYSFIYAPDTVRISNSLFQDNRVDPLSPGGNSYGGGVRHGNGPLTIAGSTFANNVANTSGGGLWTGYPFPGTIVNSTFVGNRVEGQGVDGRGGGLVVADGPYNIINTTIVDNYAGFLAGGLDAKPAHARLINSIVAGNTVGSTRHEAAQCLATLSSGSNSMQSPAPAGVNEIACIGGITRADPRLGALDDYGGLTPTIALLAGSPAIDAGASCPETDQRDAARVGACDIGAFEYGGVPPGTTPPANPPTLQSVNSDGSPVLTAQWTGVEGASRYEVEVNGGTLTNATQMISVTGNNLVVVFGRGTYTLRVRACNKIGCSGYSAAASATITSDPLRTYIPVIVR